ncbi:hypothetical protein [Aquisalimonas asiatica]|uniref:Uncharacterized protein n=1 Tax=Aquisalimonas asiatica TaxID=406100 RepID=A0A1H8RNA1_9GAMM|nr:hypothetical protein [Aquisalimonas asiatica]SEO67802.1 hypothetical protein SAMN04488052_102136 [Aquisalimonas asiatica]
MARRDEYVEKFKAQLDQWNAELAKLEAKANEAQADARLRYESEIEELRQRREEARERMKELEQAGEEAWDDFRKNAEKAWKDLDEGFRKAWSHFK